MTTVEVSEDPAADGTWILAVCDDLSWSPVNSSTAALLAARSNTFNPLDSDAA